MAFTAINVGTAANDGTGDPLRTAFQSVNSNFVKAVDGTSAVTLSAELSPTALSGDVNDYSPTGLATAFTLRIDGGAADRNITGLATGAAGRIVTLVNVGSTNKIVLKNQSSSSTAANRFLMAADVTLEPNNAVALKYDGTDSRWRPFSRALVNSGATAGSYGLLSGTVDVQGRLTVASDGTYRVPMARPLKKANSNGGVTKHAIIPPGAASTTVTLTASRLYMFPVVIPFDMTITEAHIYCGGAAAGKVVRFGIRNFGNDGQPTTLVVDFGEKSVAATGDLAFTGLSTAISAGTYVGNMISDGGPVIGGLAFPAMHFGALTGASMQPCTFCYRDISGPSWSSGTALPSDESAQNYFGAVTAVPIIGLLGSQWGW